MPDIGLPNTLYVLRVPDTETEYIVHREGSEDYAYVFEGETEANDLADWAAPIYGWKPIVEAVPLAKLSAFRIVRYIPAGGECIDVTLPVQR